MQERTISVCDMGLFGNGLEDFWVGELKGLLEDYPILEYPHQQDFYVLLFIEKAHGEVTLDNQRIRLDSTKAIVIKPRCINCIDINRQAQGKIICFTEDFFSVRYNNNQLSRFSLLMRESRSFVRIKEGDWEKYNSLLKLILKESRLKAEDSGHLLRSYLNIILFELERNYSPDAFPKARNIKVERVHRLEMLIEKHFRESKLPSYYAEKINVSPNYLNRLCKGETGQTAGDLIRKRIITEAKRLLVYTNNTIQEIGDELGFENTSYFVTFFKKYQQLTPHRFRKNYGHSSAHQ